MPVEQMKGKSQIRVALTHWKTSEQASSGTNGVSGGVPPPIAAPSTHVPPPARQLLPPRNQVRGLAQGPGEQEAPRTGATRHLAWCCWTLESK